MQKRSAFPFKTGYCRSLLSLILAASMALLGVDRSYALAPRSMLVAKDWALEVLVPHLRADIPPEIRRVHLPSNANRFGDIIAYAFVPPEETLPFLDRELGKRASPEEKYFILAKLNEREVIPFAITREDGSAKAPQDRKIWATPLIDEIKAPAELEPNEMLQDYLVARLRIHHPIGEPIGHTADVNDIRIDHSKPKFVDWSGKGHPGLEKNLEFMIRKPSGNHQVIGVFSNHGEAEAFFRYHHNQNHFGKGELRYGERERSVGVWHFDGHADDLSSGKQKRLKGHTTFAEYVRENLYNYGITNFLGGSVLNGVLFVKKWFFKNTFDGINYREVMRWAGAHYPGEPVHFDHAPTEGKFVSDQQMIDMNLDIVDVDIDIFHGINDVVQISKDIRYLAKLARPAKMVTFITSPGWIDQDLAVLYTRVLIDMLRGPLTGQQAETYADQIVARFDEVEKEKQAPEGPWKKLALRVLDKYKPERVKALRAERIQKIKEAFLRSDSEIQPPEIPKDPSVHFYHGHENLAKIQRDLQRQFQEEYDALAGALKSAPRAQGLDLKLGGAPMAAADAIAMAEKLPDPPHAFNEFFREENPVEFAIFKITWNLVSGRYPDPVPLLRTVLGLLENQDLPIELRHNLLSFLYVFGKESELFDSPYKFSYLHNWEILNWQTRLSSIEGVYVDAESRNAVQRAVESHQFSIFDLAYILSVDGGGTVMAKRKDGSLDVFGYPTGKIDSTESYALQMIKGKFDVADMIQAARVGRLRKQFEKISPPVSWKAKEWDKLRMRWDGNEAVVAQLWLLATQKTAPVIIDLHGTAFSSLQDAIDSILQAPKDPITGLPTEFTLTLTNDTWLLTPRAIVTGAFGVGDPVAVGERVGTVAKMSPDGRFVWIDFGQGEIKQFDTQYAKVTPIEDAARKTALVRIASSVDQDRVIEEGDKSLSQRTDRVIGDLAARVERIRIIIKSLGPDYLDMSLGPDYLDMDNMLGKLVHDPAMKAERVQKFLGNLELGFLSTRYEKSSQQQVLIWLDFLAAVASGDRRAIHVIMDLVDEVASLDIPYDRLTLLSESAKIHYKDDLRVEKCLKDLYFGWMEALSNDMSNLPAQPIEFDVPLEDLLKQKGMTIKGALIFLRSIDLVVLNSRNEIMLRQDLMAWLGLLSAKLPLAETVRVMNHLASLNDNVAALGWLKENMSWLRKTRSKSKALEEMRKLLPSGTEISL